MSKPSQVTVEEHQLSISRFVTGHEEGCSYLSGQAMGASCNCGAELPSPSLAPPAPTAGIVLDIAVGKPGAIGDNSDRCKE